jgi:hypothetical protein
MIITQTYRSFIRIGLQTHLNHFEEHWIGAFRNYWSDCMISNASSDSELIFVCVWLLS